MHASRHSEPRKGKKRKGSPNVEDTDSNPELKMDNQNGDMDVEVARLLTAEFWSQVQDKEDEKSIFWDNIRRDVMNHTVNQAAYFEGAIKMIAQYNVTLLGAGLLEEILGSVAGIVKAMQPNQLNQLHKLMDELKKALEGGKYEIHSLKVQSFGEVNYMASDDLNFRHGGVSRRAPRNVHLKPLDGSIANRVVVFFGASGTGKSIELAGSAYTRRSDLALVWCPNQGFLKGNVDWDAEKVDIGGHPTREEHSIKLMGTICDELRSDALETYLKRLSAIKHQDRERSRIVLCLDEMSGFPSFLRQLIATRKRFETTVKSKLAGENDIDLDVVFSVAGTGVSRGSVGSMPENFHIGKTSATSDPEAVYDTLMGTNDATPEQFRFNTLVKEAPVLSTLVLHNGRMLSIAVEELMHLRNNSKPAGNIFLPLTQKLIIERVIDKFVWSNGLSTFDVKHLPLVAACALSVHLFQEPVKIESKEEEKLAQSLNYGLKFASDEYDQILSKNISIKCLVQEAGLLVPEEFPSDRGGGDRTLEKPFALDSAMQLLCLHLLSSKTGEKQIDALGLSPFAYEVLSTNIVKATLAAAMVVHAHNRPSVQDILTNKLGFFIQQNWQVKGNSSTKTAWNRLKNVKVCRIGLKDGTEIRTSTYYHSIEAKIRSLEDLAAAGAKSVEVNGGEAIVLNSEDKRIASKRKEGVLVYDKESMRALRGVQPKDGKTKGDFIPPVTSIAFGNSPLADGYVTFLLSSDGANANARAYPFTIMVQSKDYFGSSAIDAKKLKENGDRCYAPCLGYGFGKYRLYCVASRKEVLTMNKKGKPRNFYGYAVDETSVLCEIMKRLDERRDPKIREEQYGGYYMV